MSREVPLCRADSVADGEARAFDIGKASVALVRIGEDFHAIDDVCSHADFSLAAGEVDPDECTVECWKHGALFDLRTGEALTLPATRPVAVYEVRVADGDVAVVLPDDDEVRP